MRKKRSPIWEISIEELLLVVKSSNSISDILKHFGLKNIGNNYRTLKNRLVADGIDYSHIKLGLSSNKGRKFNKVKRPISELLVENCDYNRTHLKNRLIKDGLLDYKCAKCGIGPLWNNERLSLVLDHINGINNDNRIENLRFLCPNCNSQTPTFAGRNRNLGGESRKASSYSI